MEKRFILYPDIGPYQDYIKFDNGTICLMSLIVTVVPLVLRLIYIIIFADKKKSIDHQMKISRVAVTFFDPSGSRLLS